MTRLAIGTLMAVDDNEVDQMLYARIARRSGLVSDLRQYLDPARALAALGDPQVPRPDLILLDINMPGMDGFEFLEAVGERFGDAFCPVALMLTTSLTARNRARSERFAMVQAMLDKPLTVEQLANLAQWISATNGEKAGHFDAGPASAEL